jgi:hypothetical protein
VAAGILLAVFQAWVGWSLWEAFAVGRSAATQAQGRAAVPAVLSVWRSPGPEGEGQGRTAPQVVPAVLLAVEPAVEGEFDAAAPVVFPGYLLPDDSPEEIRHGRR